MNTRLDTTIGEGTPLSSEAARQIDNRRRLPASDLIILLGLLAAALIPRIILALQLDMVTDEVVYILGGKIYLPLLQHFSIGIKKTEVLIAEKRQIFKIKKPLNY